MAAFFYFLPDLRRLNCSSEIKIVRIRTYAAVLVQSIDLVHFRACRLEVEECQIRMEFDQVDHRFDLSVLEQILQMVNLEVAHPNGLDPSVFIELLERSPSVFIGSR